MTELDIFAEVPRTEWVVTKREGPMTREQAEQRCFRLREEGQTVQYRWFEKRPERVMVEVLALRTVKKKGTWRTPKHPILDGVVTVKQMAYQIGCHPMTVCKRIREGKIKAKKVDGRWLIPESEVERAR